jgi:16S rRNA (guanine527-N7)-methyltransferase
MTEDQLDQFMVYLDEITRWNRTTNLTGLTDRDEIVIKHFVDSITALAATDFSHGASVCDIGSGAGLPGIPLRIIRPDLQLVLIEPNKKKCSFLHSVIGSLKLKNVSVVAETLEKYVSGAAKSLFDIVIARALRFDEIFKDAGRIIHPTGKLVLYRTEQFASAKIAGEFRVKEERFFTLPKGKGTRVISVLEPILQ